MKNWRDKLFFPLYGVLVFILLGAALTAVALFPKALSQESIEKKVSVQPAPPVFKTETLPIGQLYWVRFRLGEGYQLLPAEAGPLTTLEGFVRQTAKQSPKLPPWAAINAGYFDPTNGKTTSWYTLDGTRWHDPTQNERLMGNIGLKPYFEKIFNRSELRALQCGETQRYAIEFHNKPLPLNCRLLWAMGAGPELYPSHRAEEEGFVGYTEKGLLIRDPVGMYVPNARSAVGISADGQTVWLGMLARVANASGQTIKRGGTPKQLADALVKQGAARVLSLDGGTSSGFYAQGQFYYGKFDRNGQPEKRRLKSVLWVVPTH